MFLPALIVCMLCGCAASDGLTIVENGKPAATIVTAKDAPATVEFAVAELQYHLEKMTGARLPRKTDAEDVRGPVVLVGESARTRAMGLRNEDFKNREYLVRTRPGMLILIGRDKQVRGRLRYDDALSEKDRATKDFPLWPGWTKWDSVGTAFAVYHFLERECGVRWYLPSELGTTVPKRKTVRTGKLNVRRSPAMVYVEGKYKPVPKRLHWWNKSEKITLDDIRPYRDSQLWHLRNKMWGEPFSANHAFGEWPYRFYDAHPDWFAQSTTNLKIIQNNPDWKEKRLIRNWHLCLSNPEVIAQVIRDARDYFDGKEVSGIRAAGDVVAVVPMDGTRWCRCKRCRPQYRRWRKKDRPLDRDHVPKDLASDYVWRFITKVADALVESHPGKRVGALAYGYYFGVPKWMTRRRENLSVMVCVDSDRWKYRPWAREYCEAEMKKWSKLAGQLYVWIYTCFPQHKTGGRRFPALNYHEYARQMRFFHKLGVRGLFNDMQGGLYIREGLPQGIKKVSVWPNPIEEFFRWYAVVKLADDPTWDVDELYDGFYRDWFGKAAPAIKAFVAHAERIYDDPRRTLPDGKYWRRHEDVSWEAVCLDEDIEILGKHIREARRLADTPKARSRVKSFEDAVWRMIVTSRKAWMEKARKRRAKAKRKNK